MCSCGFRPGRLGWHQHHAQGPARRCAPCAPSPRNTLIHARPVTSSVCPTRPGTVFVQASCQARLIDGCTYPGTSPSDLPGTPRNAGHLSRTVTSHVPKRPLHFPIGLIALSSGASLSRPCYFSASCRPSSLLGASSHVPPGVQLRQCYRPTLSWRPTGSEPSDAAWSWFKPASSVDDV